MNLLMISSLTKKKYSKLQFTIINYSLLYFKLWYYGSLIKNGKKYGTMEKNYDTILRTMELHFTKENDIVDYQKTKKFSLIMEKHEVIYLKN